jgi:hypothetical protein
MEFFLTLMGIYAGLLPLKQTNMESIFQLLVLVFAASMVIIQETHLFVPDVWLKRIKNNLNMPLLLLAGAFCCLKADSSQNEKHLEAFFKMLFEKSEFAYTLFGDKPMSFYSYCFKTPKDCLLRSSLFEPKLEFHYKFFEEYRRFFNKERFLILDQACISSKFSTSGYTRDIILINKVAFCETVNKHLALFQQRLGENVSAECLLVQIEEKNVLFDVLKEDELLWGVLLGYGLHNAQLYAKRESIIEGKMERPTAGFATIKEELESIHNTLRAFSHEYFVDLIPLPKFLCDPHHEETCRLKKKYAELQMRICDIYQSADFLSQVLKQSCS